MAYKQLWGSKTPGHIVYLIDLSGSMENKIDYTIDVLNTVFRTIVARCTKGRVVMERVSVTIIGYNSTVKTIWNNQSVSEIATLVLDKRRSGMPLFDKTEEFKPEYQTFMAKAFDAARVDIERWIAERRKAGTAIPAPIVINITDGSPYEGAGKTWQEVFAATEKSAKALMDISTPDGNVRVFNIHHDPSKTDSTVIFPSERPSDPVDQFMYNASSEMDDDTVGQTRVTFGSKKGAHYMVSNIKEPGKLVSLIEFGSTQGLDNGSNADGSYI